MDLRLAELHTEYNKHIKHALLAGDIWICSCGVLLETRNWDGSGAPEPALWGLFTITKEDIGGHWPIVKAHIDWVDSRFAKLPEADRVGARGLAKSIFRHLDPGAPWNGIK